MYENNSIVSPANSDLIVTESAKEEGSGSAI
jgi:hypothetical protein